MRRSLLVALVIGACGLAAATALAEENKKGDDKKASIAIRDDCDPTDPAWTPTGGCTLKGGVVTFAEFGSFLFSFLAPPSEKILVGHPAWRMDPTYVRIDPDDTLRVANLGGRGHTFTEVANYGGGFVMGLNGDLLEAPACGASPTVLAPGTSFQINGLAVGNHRFQCCIHPWMRILVKVEAEDAEDHDKD